MSTSRINETRAIINRFPINLELTPGPNFTERTTYTGIYNISGLGFDMSFRVQCSENYYGPNCTTRCDGVYTVTCDGEGKPTCLLDNQTSTTFCEFENGEFPPKGFLVVYFTLLFYLITIQSKVMHAFQSRIIHVYGTSCAPLW